MDGHWGNRNAIDNVPSGHESRYDSRKSFLSPGKCSLLQVGNFEGRLKDQGEATRCFIRRRRIRLVKTILHTNMFLV